MCFSIDPSLMNFFASVLIPSLTSLAALVTAFVAFRSIKEMKNQRKSSLLPEPAFSRSYFYTYWYKTREGLPLYWSTKELIIKGFDVRSYSTSYFDVQLECYNVGFGVAKEVKAAWDFDLHKFVGVLKKQDVEKIFNFTLEANGDLRVFSKKLNYLSILSKKGITPLELKFILPAGISDRVDLVRVPTAYTELYSIFLYLFVHESTDKSAIGLNDVPSLKMIISYSDIENEKYKREYIATYKFSGVSGIIDEKNWSDAAKIEVNFEEKR